jgi:hypothetical protein
MGGKIYDNPSHLDAGHLEKANTSLPERRYDRRL